MKTGAYYFAKLSKKEQKEYKVSFENCPNKGRTLDEIFEDEWSSFKYFIIISFTWSLTPQGHEYWSKIANRKID